MDTLTLYALAEVGQGPTRINGLAGTMPELEDKLGYNLFASWEDANSARWISVPLCEQGCCNSLPYLKYDVVSITISIDANLPWVEVDSADDLAYSLAALKLEFLKPEPEDRIGKVWTHYESAKGEYCECSICTLGPEEYIRNFLPSEY